MVVMVALRPPTEKKNVNRITIWALTEMAEQNGVERVVLCLGVHYSFASPANEASRTANTAKYSRTQGERSFIR